MIVPLFDVETVELVLTLTLTFDVTARLASRETSVKFVSWI